MGYLWDIYGKTHNKERNKSGTRAMQHRNNTGAFLLNITSYRPFPFTPIRDTTNPTINYARSFSFIFLKKRQVVNIHKFLRVYF